LSFDFVALRVVKGNAGTARSEGTGIGPQLTGVVVQADSSGPFTVSRWKRPATPPVLSSYASTEPDALIWTSKPLTP
jgi:hypothetical protein